MGFSCHRCCLRFRKSPSSVSMLLSFILVFFAGHAWAMPDELYRGLVKYEVESGDYFNALVLMDDRFSETDIISQVSALEGFNISQDIDLLLTQIEREKKENDTDIDYFKLGKVAYFADQCIPALKAFKKLKNKLSLEDKQEWAFYRANCFIKLGSKVRAAQVLSDILGGIWASHAYYNLAMAYAESSANKTKALVALRVAVSLNDGKTREEQELNDRINYAAGAIYLEGDKPDVAVRFFKKVHLESATAPQALYLNGVALLEQNDFRAATQSWFSVKKYPLIHPGVAQAILAIPYAYEGSGYVSQSLEAYLEASRTFENELETIDKVEALLIKYGATKTLIEENALEELEWFLAKDIAKNTRRASYYSYFMRDEVVYDTVELLFELKVLDNSLAFWDSQLKVFDKSLKQKQTNFRRKSGSFHAPQITGKIQQHASQITRLQSEKLLTEDMSRSLQVDDMERSIGALTLRLEQLKQKIVTGKTQLQQQLSESIELRSKIQGQRKQLLALLADLDTHITGLILVRLAELREQMLFNLERAEQGLIHIFEGMADTEHVRPKRNPLDGRYR